MILDLEFEEKTTNLDVIPNEQSKAIDVDLNVLGYLDERVTVNVIKDGKLFKREHLEAPTEIKNVIKCKNPRCITTTEQELPHVFRLTDRQKKIYRCIYCESQGK